MLGDDTDTYDIDVSLLVPVQLSFGVRASLLFNVAQQPLLPSGDVLAVAGLLQVMAVVPVSHTINTHTSIGVAVSTFQVGLTV